MIGPRRRTWPDFSPCNTTTSPDINESQQFSDSSIKINPNSELIGRERDSMGSCPAWSISSFMAICPSSPSPNCSSFSPYSIISCSPTSDVFYSQISTEFSTPRNKSTCTMSNDEIEEDMNNVNDLCSFFEHNSQSKDSKESDDEEQETSPKCPSNSTEYQSIDTSLPLVGMPFPVATEESVEDKSHNGSSNDDYQNNDSDSESPVHHRLMIRPEPYHTFLDEMKEEELEDQMNAIHLRLTNKLRRKEAAINEWELKHTWRANIEMKKIENKLERKRSKAIDKMQKIIRTTQRIADEKRARERHSTVNKISKIAQVGDRDTGNLIRSKLLCF